MYQGYKELQLTNAERAELYETHKLEGYSFLENEYLYCIPEEYCQGDFCQYRHGELAPIRYPQISNSIVGTIKPRNPEQYFAFNMLLDEQTQVKVLKGVYGSGKDFIMFNAALQLVERGLYDKIIYIRPNILVKDMPDIGYLPGSVDEKLSWTLGPLVDKVGGIEGIAQLVNSNVLENIPIIHIRGREFKNSIVYVSEGQNMTVEVVKLLLGRIGDGSALWINGDTHQTDKRVFDEDNGLNKMIEKMKGHELFGYVYLPKTERSTVANLANLLDEE